MKSNQNFISDNFFEVKLCLESKRRESDIYWIVFQCFEWNMSYIPDKKKKKRAPQWTLRDVFMRACDIYYPAPLHREHVPN